MIDPSFPILPEVPADRIVAIRARVAAPDVEAVRAYWHRCWDIAETRHNGDGSWGRGNEDWDPTWRNLDFVSISHTPLPRHSARMILACLPILEGREDIYPGRELLEKRLRQAADYLCAMLEPAGYLPTYTRSPRGVRPFEKGFDSVLYPTGLALQALSMAYRYFKIEAFRQAAARIHVWNSTFPASPNYNFDSFLVSGSALYRLACEPEAEFSSSLVRLSPALAWQQPHGGWLGAPLNGRHNGYTWYHSVCIHAFLNLLSVLPPDQAEARARLQQAAFRGVNYILNLHREDGSLQVHPEDSRVGNVAESALMLIKAQAVLEVDLQAAIDGLIAWQISPASGDPDLMQSLHFPPKGDTFTRDHVSYTLLPLGHYLAGKTRKIGT